MKNYLPKSKPEILTRGDQSRSNKSFHDFKPRVWTITTNDTKVSLLTSIQVNRYDVLKQVSWKVKQSVCFVLLYSMLIIANGVVLVWYMTRSKKHRHIMFWLEASVNLAFVLEVMVTILIQTPTYYFSRCWNCLDFIICLACLVLSGFFLYQNPKIYNDVEVEVQDDLLEVRYFISFIRVCRFALTAMATRKTMMQSNVRFDTDCEEVVQTLDQEFLEVSHKSFTSSPKEDKVSSSGSQ